MAGGKGRSGFPASGKECDRRPGRTRRGPVPGSEASDPRGESHWASNCSKPAAGSFASFPCRFATPGGPICSHWRPATPQWQSRCCIMSHGCIPEAAGRRSTAVQCRRDIPQQRRTESRSGNNRFQSPVFIISALVDIDSTIYVGSSPSKESRSSTFGSGERQGTQGVLRSDRGST
eukprot:scaffold2129_cov255-Pinguiococcus_pyrenoidosus.AAC.7